MDDRDLLGDVFQLLAVLGEAAGDRHGITLETTQHFSQYMLVYWIPRKDTIA